MPRNVLTAVKPLPFGRRRLSTAQVVFISLAVGAFALLWLEIRTSTFQARIFGRLARQFAFEMGAGSDSSATRLTRSGPYDERLGYTRIPAALESLERDGYVVSSQARPSPELRRALHRGLFPVHFEKPHAGLVIRDRAGAILFDARYPQRTFQTFDEIPGILVNTLVFVENRELLRPKSATSNPAVEWDRFGKAILDVAWSRVDPRHDVSGGSTLLTQVEKMWHSPGGQTTSGKEKLRQMTSASLRAYEHGENTLEVRKQTVLDYLNWVPLAAVAGHGEVHGLGDAMWSWYGEDFEEMRRVLTREPEAEIGDPPASGQRRGRPAGASDDLLEARVFKEALSLILAQRRPTYYLLEDRDALFELTDVYLGLMTDAGLISEELRDRCRQITLSPRRVAPERAPVSFVERKAANTIRPRLLSLLDVHDLYQLDRLDLTVESTIDAKTQATVTTLLRRLADPAVARKSGLVGERMLGKGDPARVVYSVALYERSGNANLLRIQTDNFDQPLNINEGIKLDLGSTAKLRTLITYLEVLTEAFNENLNVPAADLKAKQKTTRDKLTKWTLEYLAGAKDKRLSSFLEAALGRTYSASPAEKFFTGGGMHEFENFDDTDDPKKLTVREALHRSVNLVFIRMMKDIVDYHLYHGNESPAMIFEDVDNPQRHELLARFAEREGRAYVTRFHKKYAGQTPDQVLELVTKSIRPIPGRLAIVFRSMLPEATLEQFSQFIRGRLPEQTLSDSELAHLYAKYAPGGLDLVDRAYSIRIHPLELWVAEYLFQHPEAKRDELVGASRDERQRVYDWLFTARKRSQDSRIFTLLEIEAFLEIHRSWQRLGYPFEYLTPSLATAIGSSGDRPAALAELVGILVSDGVRLPSIRVERLHFAEDTPFEAVLDRAPGAGEQVLAPEIARAVRKAMIGVVEQGTAVRMRGAFSNLLGFPVQVGGKTGTGDHRNVRYASDGREIESKVMNRTATFAFFIGDRYFGTVTAYVAGSDAANYEFTSSLPVQLLRVVAPTLAPMIKQSLATSQESKEIAQAVTP
jgi:membrane peptidoglycan carboxypeptidase